MASSSTSNTDLINLDDFKSMDLQIALENTTTKTEIRDGKKIFGQTEINDTQSSEIKLIEFGDHAVTLDVPSGTCAEGHHLTLYFKVKMPQTSCPNFLEFITTAKVEKIEKPSPDRHTVFATMIQYEEASWQCFCQTFSGRQNEIEQFFQAVKGY